VAAVGLPSLFLVSVTVAILLKAYNIALQSFDDLKLLLAAMHTVFGAGCEPLSALSLPAATITRAEAVAAGAFTLPNLNPGQQTAFRQLPAFCRVAATIRPTPDSEIKIEVWMPADGWNSKFMGVGNGGWSGGIVYPALATALGRGYAAASTNTGHDGGDASFVPGHPEKLVDFAYRAVHEMTVKAKAIMAAHYGRGPRLSYWTGCSTGGRQGLLEAQRYPADFDGIIAGAPANNQIQLSAWRFALETAALKEPARVVPLAKTAQLNRAVLAACDALDGVKDGFLSDPQKCRFDPSTLLCRGASDGDCLTAPQLESVKPRLR
jgi:feruloyl esterase